MITLGIPPIHLIEQDLKDADVDDQLVSPLHSISHPFFSKRSVSTGPSVVTAGAGTRRWFGEASDNVDNVKITKTCKKRKELKNWILNIDQIL